MSPRLGAITDRIPYASSTQTAISRDEPQPKFSAKTRILAPRYGAWFRTNSGFSEPSALKRTSRKRKPAYPGAPLGFTRKRAGMMRSVSMLGRSSGAATAVSLVKGSTSALKRADVGEAARHRGGGRHRRRHQVRARALALSSFEVAIRGGGHALALARGLAVHPHAHRAARLAPLEAGRDEDAVEPFGLGGTLDQPRARHDPRGHRGAAPLHHPRDRAQVLEPAVGAGADEDAIHPDLRERRAGLGGRRRSSRRAPPCRRARPPRSTCCRPSCARPWTWRGRSTPRTRSRAPRRRPRRS